MSLHFANRIDWRMMSPQVALALQVASECFGEEGEDCLVTCIKRPGDFKRDGLHAIGQAADLAVRRYRGGELIPLDAMDRIVAKLQSRLGRTGGGQFDVVDERAPGSSPRWTGPHIHIEFDPK